jgi:Na+/H+ antiporter NhaC
MKIKMNVSRSNFYKITTGVLSSIILFFVVVFGYQLTAKHIESKTIQDLKMNYTPGPYDPGFNPDRMAGQQEVGFTNATWVKKWEESR